MTVLQAVLFPQYLTTMYNFSQLNNIKQINKKKMLFTGNLLDQKNSISNKFTYWNSKDTKA